MKFSMLGLVLLVLSTHSFARPVAVWTYEKLTEEADLIVIATPTASADTKEKTVLPNLQKRDEKGQATPIAVLGVETKFTVLTVLKGEKKLTELTLYHLRADVQADVEVPNGPNLVTFDVKAQRRFLMFLKRQADGRYASLTGQIDPHHGLKDVGSYP